jgi:hypothetical protein
MFGVGPLLVLNRLLGTVNLHCVLTKDTYGEVSEVTGIIGVS